MALLVAVVAAFVPLFWLITTVALAVGVLALRHRRPGNALNAGIVAAVPLVLLLPWTVELATDPARIFLEAGVVRPGLATPGLAARSLLLLSPGGPGLPPFWVTVGLAATAAAALAVASRRQAPLVLAGWTVGVTGLIFAALVSHISVSQAGPAGAVAAWPGPALAVAGAGLLLALVAASDWIHGRLGSGGWRSVTGLAVLGLGILACSAPALAAAYWVSSGVTGPVRPASGPLLPEFVAVSSDTGLRLRTLVLQTAPGGGVTYTVLRNGDPLIGSQELPLLPPAQRAANLAVATLTAPAGGAARDQGRVLASLGVGYVLLPAPIDANLARMLDGVPGLRPVSVTGQFDLWRVVDTTAQVTVVESGGKVAAVASGPVSVAGARAPAAGGTLVLAAPAGGWSASLNGHPLTPLPAPVNGWAQGFRLPPGGGSLSVSRSDIPRGAVVALTGLAVLVVAGLGLPGSRAAGAAERAAVPPVPDGEERAAGEDEEPAEPGRRAGHGRGKGRRSSRRGRAEPSPDTAVLRPAAPAQAATRSPDAVPAGTRRGWPRRGGGRADAEPSPGDEPEYAGGPAYQDAAVAGPAAGELTAQTVALGARGSGTGGRHSYQADRDQPAGRDSAPLPGPRQGPGRPPGRRRRPGPDPAPPAEVAPPGRWGEADPRDPAPAGAGEPPGYGPAHGRGGYPGARHGPGSQTGPQAPFGGPPGGRGPDGGTGPQAAFGGPRDSRDAGGATGPQAQFGRGVPGDRHEYPHTRRAFGRRGGHARDAGGGAPEGYPDPRQGDDRRAPAPGGRAGRPGRLPGSAPGPWPACWPGPASRWRCARRPHRLPRPGFRWTAWPGGRVRRWAGRPR